MEADRQEAQQALGPCSAWLEDNILVLEQLEPTSSRPFFELDQGWVATNNQINLSSGMPRCGARNVKKMRLRDRRLGGEHVSAHFDPD
jgi:hypothetical protein